MSTWGTVIDHRTGEKIRPATAEEWRNYADQHNAAPSQFNGTWQDEGRTVHLFGGPEVWVDRKDIEALRTEAAEAGDPEQVYLCYQALERRGQERWNARAECVRVILDTRMEAAGDAELSEETQP
jgi:hypothetical protein